MSAERADLLKQNPTVWPNILESLFDEANYFLDEPDNVIRHYHIRREGFDISVPLSDINAISVHVANSIINPFNFSVDIGIIDELSEDKEISYHIGNAQLKVNIEDKSLLVLDAAKADGEPILTVFASGRTEPHLREITTQV